MWCGQVLTPATIAKVRKDEGEIRRAVLKLVRDDPEVIDQLERSERLMDVLADRPEIEEQIDTWQSEYGVESPETLRRRASRTDTADRTRQLRQAANAWEIVQYRLGLVDEAINLSTE